MAFTPREVGPMFNHSVSWVYRALIYSGKVRVLTSLGGDMLIPRSELERLLSEASVYNPNAEPETNPDNGNEGEE